MKNKGEKGVLFIRNMFLTMFFSTVLLSVFAKIIPQKIGVIGDEKIIILLSFFAIGAIIIHAGRKILVPRPDKNTGKKMFWILAQIIIIFLVFCDLCGAPEFWMEKASIVLLIYEAYLFVSLALILADIQIIIIGAIRQFKKEAWNGEFIPAIKKNPNNGLDGGSAAYLKKWLDASNLKKTLAAFSNDILPKIHEKNFFMNSKKETSEVAKIADELLEAIEESREEILKLAEKIRQADEFKKKNIPFPAAGADNGAPIPLLNQKMVIATEASAKPEERPAPTAEKDSETEILLPAKPIPPETNAEETIIRIKSSDIDTAFDGLLGGEKEKTR